MDLTRSLYDGHCRIRKRFLIEEDIIMKRKKLTGTIAAATLVMGMLAGCGASDTAAADTAAAAAETTAADTAAAAETTAETTAAETTAEAVTGEVTAAGSSALLPLAQAAAEKFMDANPDCSVTVNGGGSGEGLKQTLA